MGNVPKRHTAHIWCSVQSLVEAAGQTGEVLSGVVADVVKAFNVLPRLPIFAIAAAIGVDSGVIRAWAGACTILVRRFRVRRSVGPAIPSSTGLPEGCGLLVVGMMLLNQVMAIHLKLADPGIQVLTYVDNYELLQRQGRDVAPAFRAMQAFADMADLQLDSKKTFGWSTSTEGRQLLQAQGLPVRYAERDLGAHMQYCKPRHEAAVASAGSKLFPACGKSQSCQDCCMASGVAWNRQCSPGPCSL